MASRASVFGFTIDRPELTRELSPDNLNICILVGLSRRFVP